MMRGRVGIVGIVGIVGMWDRGRDGGTDSRTRPEPPNPRTRTPTFVWLEPTFENEFPPAEGAAYMDQQGQMFMPDTLLVRTGSPSISAAAKMCCTTSA